MESSLTQNKSFARTAFALIRRRLKTSLGFLQQRKNQTVVSSKEELDKTTEVSAAHANQEENLQLAHTENRVNCKVLENFQRSPNHEFSEIIVRNLDEAINFYQSDYIVLARAKLQDVLKQIKKLGARNVRIPTRYGWQVSDRGKELFFENNVNCSLKHGTIILDSSNAGAQFHVSLLDILGAFSTQVSEFKIAKETFSILISLHVGKSNATSRLRDLAAAYNNRGCLSLIMGEYDQAESDFKNSLTHLKWERQAQLPGSTTEAMIIGVNSNISRLNLMSRNFAQGLEQQEQLVEVCKTEAHELPLQTMCMILYNQAVLHITLGNMAKAEKELKWLIMYCNGTRREKCDVLLNFVSLQLCEVLLLRGKPDEADKVYEFELLTSKSVQELMPLFINFNVRIEEFEKKIDVLVQKGKLKFAHERLQRGIELVKKSFGSDHFNVASLLYKEGSILKLMGDISGSLKKFKWSAEILRDIFNEKHPLLIKCYMSLGAVSLRLGLTDESYIYFQRAMENVEVIHQVSFPNQLSMKFIKMTKTSKHAPLWGLQGRNTQEQMIEGLVAEHGEALAVLLSRQDFKVKQPFRGTRDKRKQPLLGKMLNVRQTESVLIISQKVVRDLLLSGQTLLRHGMKKEAVAFFQQASKRCQAYHLPQGQCSASLVRLYSVISQTSLKDQDKLENNRALKSYLEELKEDIANNGIDDGSEKSSKDTEKLTLDSQLTLKLVLIFLILLSIQLQMHDTTFAAYDLYTNLSPNDDRFFVTVNDELQVYASRTSVVCNGKTAVQDVLFSSAIGENKTDSECHLSGEPLFRSLSYRNNVPTYSFLAISSAPVFLDVDDVKQLENTLLHSFQDYLQTKYLDNQCDVPTQIVVDLTATSFSEQHILQNGSRIELLPLCLSEEVGAEEVHDEGRSISVIFPGLCEKTTLMTFSDERTSCLIFGRIALRLFQQYKWGTISSLRVQHQCIALTVVDPVKARITLWYEDMSIKQKVQVINSAEGIHPSGWIGPRQPSCEGLMGSSSHCCREIEQFFAPAILHCANTHEVPCETTVVRRQCSYCVEPQTVLDESCVPDSFHLNVLQPENAFPQIACEDNEKSVRESLKVGTLECLTAISELSRQRYGDAVQEKDEITVHPHLTETDRMSSTAYEDTTSNPPDHDTTSSRLVEDTICTNFPQPNHESDPERRQLLTLKSPDLLTTEADHLSLKERDTTIKDSDEAIVLGRKQFEEHRKSRGFSIAQLQEDLKKTERWRKMNPLDSGDGSINDISEDNASSASSSHDESHNHGSCKSESTVCGTEKAEDQGESDEEKEEHCTDSCEYLQVSKEKKITGVVVTRLETKEENGSKPLNDAGPQKATEDVQTDIIETVMVNILPNTGATNPVLNEASGVSQNECETGFFNRIQTHHGKVNDVEMDHEEIAQDEDVIFRNPNIESVLPKNDVSQSKFGKYHHARMTKDYKPYFQERKEAPRDGPQTQNITDYPIAESPMERNYPCFEVGVLNSGKSSSSKQNATRKEESEKLQLLFRTVDPNKDSVKTSIRPTFLGDDVVAEEQNRTEDFVDAPDLYQTKKVHKKDQSTFQAGNEVVADGCSTNAFPQATQDVYDGLALFHTDQVRSKDRKATSFQSPFLGGDVVADGYITDALPKTTQNDVDGPASTTENYLSSYSSREGMGVNEGNAFKSKRNVNEVKRINDLEPIRNRDPITFESGDVVDGPIKPPKDSRNVSRISPDFSGARPKQRFPKTSRKSSPSSCFMGPISNQQFKESPLGLDPNFVARHAVINSSPSSSFHNLTLGGETREVPQEGTFDEQRACSNVHNSYKPNSSSSVVSANEAMVCAIQSSLQSQIIHQATPPRKDESWHFPPLPTHFYDDHECATQQSSTELYKPLFDFPQSRSDYVDLVSMTNEFYNRNISYCESPEYSAGGSQVLSVARRESQQNSREDSTTTLLAHLKETMTRTVSLIASNDAARKQANPEQQPAEKVGIQEQARGEGENEHTEIARERNSTEQENPLPRNERTVDMEREDRTTPVQESPRSACGHYQRRCLVKFPCCGRFYPCHRCHNESTACSDDQARAINATHMRCTICYHEQLIDEGGQKCGGCNSKMSDYFCAICKHYTSVDKNPFHCGKCGICRIHSDKSFHCDVCNVCLDKRLQGKHKCRPDSGHDECCICLEDAFSGCQILPCSHKVHKDCAIAMIQNGVRTCPICRHPLFQQPEGTQ